MILTQIDCKFQKILTYMEFDSLDKIELLILLASLLGWRSIPPVFTVVMISFTKCCLSGSHSLRFASNF